MMRPTLLSLVPFLAMLSSPSAAAEIVNYSGMCEASTAEALDDTHFAVASDESNFIQVYRLGNAKPLTDPGINVTDDDKSDLEASAKVGKRIYWISSHSYNSSGEDKKKRKTFFATDIVREGGAPTLKAFGAPYGKLRNQFPEFLQNMESQINIEGMAASPDDGLYIGFRAPLKDDKAIVLPLENADKVVADGKKPRFGEPMYLNLGKRGIRSIERVDLPDAKYLIVGGPVADGGTDFKLFTWSGDRNDHSPKQVEIAELSNLKPEALFRVPDTNRIEILSDDDLIASTGATCSDGPSLDPGRSFRALDLLWK
jgi:hypothetical protein